MQSKISVAGRNKINTMAYRKIEEYDEKTTKELAGHVKAILKLLGEDPEREGLVKTPERVAKAWQFLTQGYEQNGETIVRSAVFTEPYSQMVLVKDIELFSLCEHHMSPTSRTAASPGSPRSPAWWRPTPAACRSRSA